MPPSCPPAPPHSHLWNIFISIQAGGWPWINDESQPLSWRRAVCSSPQAASIWKATSGLVFPCLSADPCWGHGGSYFWMQGCINAHLATRYPAAGTFQWKYVHYLELTSWSFNLFGIFLFSEFVFIRKITQNAKRNRSVWGVWTV